MQQKEMKSGVVKYAIIILIVMVIFITLHYYCAMLGTCTIKIWDSFD